MRQKWKRWQPPGVEPRTPLAWAASALPLSNNSQMTTNPHSPQKHYYYSSHSVILHKALIDHWLNFWFPWYSYVILEVRAQVERSRLTSWHLVCLWKSQRGSSAGGSIYSAQQLRDSFSSWLHPCSQAFPLPSFHQPLGTSANPLSPHTVSNQKLDGGRFGNKANVFFWLSIIMT